MKKIFAILMTVILLISICSCKSEKNEKNKYELIYGYQSTEATNVVEAKCVENDLDLLRFELINNLGEEFVAYVTVLGGNYEVDYTDEWFYKTREPDFHKGETYILWLKWKPYTSSGNSNSGRYQVLGAYLCK